MGRKGEGGGQISVCHLSLYSADIMWHSSFLFQLLWNVNIQYLLIGYSWDLINHSNECFYTVLRLTDYRAVSSSYTGCESFSLSRKQISAGSWKMTYLSLNHHYILWMAVVSDVFIAFGVCFPPTVLRKKKARIGLQAKSLS